MKKIGILGSTGSIGTQTLDIVRMQPDLQVTALAAGSNTKLLEAQIREFKPAIAAVWDELAAEVLAGKVADTGTKIVSGMEGLIEVSTEPLSDILVTAIVGMIGIRPTIAAIEAGKDIALANKETLVCAGHIIMPLARDKKVKILPVDSEHSAIFQSLNGEPVKSIEKILLTASGGPFRGKKRSELEKMTLEDALKHPNWSMGRKVTIDSASLCNKGLEVMEARWLFDIDLEHIQVLIHPQSILHSAVQFCDGAIMGQMGAPDMKLPIQYALFYPERRTMDTQRVDLFTLGSLTFEEPDTETFPGLRLAYEAGRRGGSLPTVFNAANEEAVRLLVEGRIPFVQIPEVIQRCMEAHKVKDNPDVSDILNAEAETREYTERVYR